MHYAIESGFLILVEVNQLERSKDKLSSRVHCFSQQLKSFPEFVGGLSVELA